MAGQRVYWGWVVCASFLALFTLSAGVAFSFTETLVPISHELTNTSMSLLTWVGALPCSIPMLAAPLTSWLHQRDVSARSLVLAGVIMTSLALASMALAQSDVIVSLAVYGVLGGAGLLLVTNPPFFLIDSYFPYEHPRHVLATSVVACAFPLATLIFNPLTYALLASLGWRATYALYAGFTLPLGALAALAFRAPAPGELARELHGPPTAPLSAPPQQGPPDVEGKVCVERGRGGYEEISCTEESSFALSYQPSATRQGVGLQQLIDDELSQQQQQRQQQQQAELQLLQSPIETLVIPTRAKVVMSVIFFLASVLKCMGYYTPIFILVKQMEMMGIPQRQASLAMALIGLCEFISRLVTSYVGDRFKGRILLVYVGCTLMLCLQNLLGAHAHTYTHILLYSAALGVFGGPIIAAMYSSCSEVLGGQHVPTLFSLFRVGLGVGVLLGPTLAGLAYDATGSFSAVFYVSSVTYALTSLLYALILLLNWARPACLRPAPSPLKPRPQYSAVCQSTLRAGGRSDDDLTNSAAAHHEQPAAGNDVTGRGYSRLTNEQ